MVISSFQFHLHIFTFGHLLSDTFGDDDDDDDDDDDAIMTIFSIPLGSFSTRCNDDGDDDEASALSEQRNVN